MQTNLCDSARQRAEAAEAERILRSCVHCGFCNATCPTYQELGDELDGPRGRIYLIKQFLERDEASERTRLH
ncbi:4Fe-4S dicluster domain-containing protein, partial [Pseudomonas aeruginosa]